MIGDVVSDEITREMLDPYYGYPRALNMVAVWMIVVTPLTKFGLCSRPLNVAVEGFLNLAPAPAVVAQREAEHEAEREGRTSTEYARSERYSGEHLRSPLLRPRRHSITGAMESAISVFSTAGVSDYLGEDDSTIGERPKSPLPVAEPDGAAEGRKGIGRIACRIAITVTCVATAVLLPGFGQVLAFLGSFSAFLICIILPVSTERGARSATCAVNGVVLTDSLASGSAWVLACSSRPRRPATGRGDTSTTWCSLSPRFSWAWAPCGALFPPSGPR